MTELEAVAGVGPTAAKRLRDNFITTAEILSIQNPMELQIRTKLGEATVANIIRNARGLTKKFEFRSGIELEKQQAEIPRLKFGMPQIDDRLRGGLRAGSMVELYGGARTGKTQWSHHLAVRAQMPLEQGGLEGRVLWLDSESSFMTETVRANAIRWGQDPNVVLGNIRWAPIALSGQITELSEQIQLMLAEGEYKMLVIDSLTGLFRQEYTGIGKLASRQYGINYLLNWMRRMGLATDTMFVYTNQVTTQINNWGGNPSAPVGGHIMSHASDYRFFCRVGQEGKRKLTLRDHAGVPEFTEEIHMGWGGFYKGKKEMTDTETMLEERLGTIIIPPDDADKIPEVEEPKTEDPEEPEKKKGKKETGKKKGKEDKEE